MVLHQVEAAAAGSQAAAPPVRPQAASTGVAVVAGAARVELAGLVVAAVDAADLRSATTTNQQRARQSRCHLAVAGSNHSVLRLIVRYFLYKTRADERTIVLVVVIK